MKYLTHTVYVVANGYPLLGSIETDIIREARPADLSQEKLGVINEGRVVPLSQYEREQLQQRQASPLARAVRVKFRKDGDGWSYDVLAADSLQWLGSGWSAGRKSDAQNDFCARAAREGWVSTESRQERQRGAA